MNILDDYFRMQITYPILLLWSAHTLKVKYFLTHTWCGGEWSDLGEGAGFRARVAWAGEWLGMVEGRGDGVKLVRGPPKAGVAASIYIKLFISKLLKLRCFLFLFLMESNARCSQPLWISKDLCITEETSIHTDKNSIKCCLCLVFMKGSN